MQHPFPRKNFDRIQKSPKQHKMYCLGRTLSAVPPNFRGSLCTLPVRDSALSDTVSDHGGNPLKSTEGAAPFGSQLEVTFRALSRELTPAAPSLRILSRVLFLVNAFRCIRFLLCIIAPFFDLSTVFSRRLKTLSAAGSANQIARARDGVERLELSEQLCVHIVRNVEDR